MSFAYVNPKLDIDVSTYMETTGMVEMGISQVRCAVWWEDIRSRGIFSFVCLVRSSTVLDLSQVKRFENEFGG